MKLLNKMVLLVILFLGISSVYAEPVYTEDNLNFDVTARKRDFSIILRDHSASTGISWNEKPEYPEELFELRDHKKYPATMTLVGAPGSEVWVFHVPRAALRKTQTVKIKFTTVGPAADSQSHTLVFDVTLKAMHEHEEVVS